MFAITNIAGQQFKVSEGQELYVHRLKAEEGSLVKFDEVQLLSQDGTVKIGKPFIKGASVEATVLNHLKGDKVIVFKKKRRKGFKVKKGHRQYLTKIKIDSISS